MHFLPCRARWKTIWSASRVFPAPGSPATRLMDRVGSPPPRMRSRSGLPVARSSRLGWFLVTDPLGCREDSPLLQPRNLLDAADDDLPRQFHQQRSELADQLAQRDRRVLDLPNESARQRVGVPCVGPQDLELAELRAAEHCPPRGAAHERGRGGGAENVGEAIPDQLEQRRTAHLGGIVDARSSAVRNVRWSHVPLTLCDADPQPNSRSDKYLREVEGITQRDGSGRYEQIPGRQHFQSCRAGVAASCLRD